MRKKCAYCESQQNKNTKEHVVNKAFLDTYYKIGLSYAHCFEKVTKNYLTVKDVCNVCNSGILSDYDKYFLSFYKKHFTETNIKPNDKIEINYDYNKLSKWILKTLYNSERKNGYKFIEPVLNKFKKHIINKNSKSNNFQIYIELLSDIPEKEITKAKNNNKSLSELPKKLSFLKLGNQFYKYDGLINMAKYIISSNFAFHVFIDFENEENMKKQASLYKEIRGISNFFHLIPNKDRMDLKASCRNILDMLEKSLEGDLSFEERFSKYFEKINERSKSSK